MNPIQPTPELVLCGRAPNGVGFDELGQLMRAVYPEAPLFLVCLEKDQYDRSYLQKMGYREVYLSPIDWTSLGASLLATMSSITDGRIKAFHPVKLVDIKPGAVLDFDTFLYLPVNDRYVHYSSKGDPIDPNRAAQLVGHQVGTIYIRSQQLPAFYNYVKAQFGGGDTHPDRAGMTSSRDGLRSAMRDFFADFFKPGAAQTSGDGARLTRQIEEIARTYILNLEVGNWYLPLLSWSGEPYEHYAHASSVGLYATALAIGLGVKGVEDIAIAGLLHDCGHFNLTTEILQKNEGDWTESERERYRRHPELGRTLLRNRRLQLSDTAWKIIFQHHERHDGRGFPLKLTGAGISMKAQIVALADQLDEAISVKPGQPMSSPLQKLRQLQREPSAAINPELVEKVLAIFPDPGGAHVQS